MSYLSIPIIHTKNHLLEHYYYYYTIHILSYYLYHIHIILNYYAFFSDHTETVSRLRPPTDLASINYSGKMNEVLSGHGWLGGRAMVWKAGGRRFGSWYDTVLSFNLALPRFSPLRASFTETKALHLCHQLLGYLLFINTIVKITGE